MKVNRISSKVVFLLQEEKKAVVHSIYKNTINFKVEEDVYSIHPKGIALSPYGIELDVSKEIFEALSFVVGEAVSLNRIFIKESDMEIWEPKIKRCFTKEELLLRLPILKQVVAAHREKGGFSDAACQCSPVETDDFLTSVLRTYVKDLREESYEILKKFIGCGVGLTPSGDDFLVGMLLAALVLEKEAVDIKKMVVENIKHTNDISGQFLKAACNGEFGEKLQILVKPEQREEDFFNAVEEVIKTGHTSGLDTLNGLIVGSELFC